MRLNDRQVQNLKPTPKKMKIYDGGGLYACVLPNGTKSWRFDYRFATKRKTLVIGRYPVISLKLAREKLLEAKQLLFVGKDPSHEKQNEKRNIQFAELNSFEAVANEWLEINKEKWAESHAKTVRGRLERDIFPFLGSATISSIDAFTVLQVIKKIEERGANESARRTLQICDQVFRYAVITRRRTDNPTPNLKGALKPVSTSHLAAIIDPPELGGLLRSIDTYKGKPIVRLALKLAPLVFLRPKELRTGEWNEIDLEKRIWSIPATKMKMREPHIVPLSRQSIEILSELKFLTGEGAFLFPGVSREKPMSDNAVLSALRRMGYTSEEMTGHGFRATARTLLDEELKCRVDLIEHQLAHAVRDPNGRAYNRTTHIEERREMMQKWADYLDSLKSLHDEREKL